MKNTQYTLSTFFLLLVLGFENICLAQTDSTQAVKPSLLEKYQNFMIPENIISQSADSSATLYRINATTVVARFYSTSSGNLRRTSTGSYTRTNGALRIQNESSTGCSYGYRSWARFDISAIPSGSTIRDVNQYLWCTARVQATFDYLNYDIYRVINDPSNSTNATLWTDIADGSQYENDEWVLCDVAGFCSDPPGVEWSDFNSPGDADLQAALSSGWFAIGYMVDCQENNSTFYATFSGYNDATQTRRPYLLIEYTPPTRTLTVASSNPNSGVSITVTPNDNNNQGNGTTQFTRTYDHGTVVTLTAPSTASGNRFLKWQRSGSDWSTNRQTSVTVDANYTMTAVYVTQRTMTVASSNPNSGVSITVTPNDNNNQGNGTTQFTRTYDHGTVVTLTAPSTASGNGFFKWQRDGSDWSSSRQTNVTMNSNLTMTAIYVAQRTLTVASSNPSAGVAIAVTPNDNNNQGNGTTQFTRTYTLGTIVTLTAPPSANGNNFHKWQQDGSDFSIHQQTNLTMDANHTMRALYHSIGDIVDVLVVYTTAAETWANDNVGSIDLAISQALAIAQYSSYNSNSGVSMRLAHSAQVDYTESGDSNSDLGRLSDPSDGYMDNVHQLRQTYQADLVALLVSQMEQGVGGRAYILGNTNGEPAYAFSVTLVQGYNDYTLGHEIGHNLGCAHDRENANGPGLFAYSYGWRFNVNTTTFRTVMAYPPGNRIPYFSSPLVTFEGVPTGVTEGSANAADNARTMREIAAVISDYSNRLQTFTISGYVRTSAAAGIIGVTLSGLPGNPSTDANGFYSGAVDNGWSGTATPTKTGYTFTPTSTSYSNVTSNRSTNYTGTLQTFTISGYVRTSAAAGIIGVTLSGLPGNPSTDANGLYSGPVDYGWSGTATPTKTGYTFNPPSTSYTNVTSNKTSNYTGSGPMTVEYLSSPIPDRYALFQNFPNPFNPVTTIQFSLPKSSIVKLSIFNPLGIEVETLVNNYLTPGNYRTEWTPREIASGVYFYQIRAGEFAATRKLLLIR